MSAKFINVDRDTPMFLPPDMRDWLPEDHIVHFIIDAVNHVNIQSFSINHRGSGSAQYPPSMMMSLLIYCYATGRFSSRVIEEASYSDIAVRYLCGGHHPDHDTVCKFRRENGPAFRECFVKVLELAVEMNVLSHIGTVSVDGSKFKANASKHSAVSYKRAGEMLEQLRLEVEELVRKAEDADSAPLEDGLSVPDEISRREERIKRLEEARRIIEERRAEQYEQEEKDYEAKLKAREKKRKNGRKRLGPEPKPPVETPDDKTQYNFTDGESRIMKSGNGPHFEQCYNGQLAVEAERSRLITGGYATDRVNDKKELNPVLRSVPEDIMTVANCLADNGFFSEEAVKEAESGGVTTVYAPGGKQSHGRKVSDLEKKDDPPPPPEGAPLKEIMEHRLKTRKGKELYKLRKQTVEPAFGDIKHNMGFRQFLLRGLAKVNIEWELVKNAYNFRKLFNLTGGFTVSADGTAAALRTVNG